MDRDIKRLLYSVLAGVVSLAVNIYHFVYAIRDGIPLYPFQPLYDYEAPVGLMLRLARDFAGIAGALWTGMVIYAVHKAAKRTAGTKRMEK